MKRLVKWLLIPSVVLLGMAFLATPDADAARWRRHYYGYHYAPHASYAPAPPAVRVYAPAPPAVQVYAPGVHVQVAPPVVPAHPYYYGPPAVVVPPRIITPWFQMW